MHRKQASVYDVAAAAAARRPAAWSRPRSRCSGGSPRPRSGPYAVVLGGAKVSDKLAVIDNLLQTADRLLIGGGMVFTFLAAQGHEVGKSLLEADQVDTVQGLPRRRRRARRRDRAADRHRGRRPRSRPTPTHDVVAADAIPADRMGLDIGPRVGAAASPTALADARTVFWNGPMGVFEMAPYAEGTRAVAAGAHRGTDGRSPSSAAATRPRRCASSASPTSQFGHISTGGGASLEYLEGKHAARPDRPRGLGGLTWPRRRPAASR